MRWIFIILLMCNGIYFLWQSSMQSEPVPVQAIAAPVEQEDTPKELMLLSELSAQERQQLSSAATQQDQQAAESDAVSDKESGPPEQKVCWLIGPFKEEVSGKQVVSRLEALDISLQLTTIELEGKPDYWVHIPPLASRQAAIKLLRELQSKKIDSFLIGEGELQNGLSLGFFTQKDSAQAVYEERVEQGYSAEIKLVPRVYTELWAVFDTGEYGKFSDALWEKIIEGNKGLERRKNYCDRIASVDNLE